MTLALRQYSKTALMAAAGFIGDNPLFIVDSIMRFLRVALLLAVWRTLFRNAPEVGGMTLPVVLTYTLIGEVFSDPMAAQTSLADAFWSGDVALRLLRPMGAFGQFLAESMGRWIFEFGLFSIPLLCAAPLFGVNPLPASPLAFVAFIISLVLAVTVGTALDFLFVSLAIWMRAPVYAVTRIRNAIGTLLSGRLIPLALLPFGIGRVLDLLPFASVASAPLRIYTGANTGPGEILRLLAIQAFWALTLWPLAHRFWYACRERVVSYGG